jgi:hypothetical protein
MMTEYVLMRGLLDMSIVPRKERSPKSHTPHTQRTHMSVRRTRTRCGNVNGYDVWIIPPRREHMRTLL